MGKQTRRKKSEHQQLPAPNPAGHKSQSLDHFRQALDLQMSGDPAGALEFYDRAIASEPAFADAHFNRGIILKELGRYEEALAAYGRTVVINPDFSEAHYNQGNILQILRRYEESLACFDRAITINPFYAEAHNNRAATLKALGKYEEALAAYDQVIALKPAYAAAYNSRGNVLEKLGRYEDALATYDRAIDILPDNPVIHYQRGNILQELNRLEEALTAWNRAIAIHPDFAEAYTNRGAVLMQLGKPEEALQAHNRAITINPDFAIAHANRGMVLYQQGKIDESLAGFDRAIAINPGHVEAYFNRGIVLMKLQRYEEALVAFERTISLNPASVDAYYNRGFILHSKKKYNEALSSYNQAIAINPQHILSQWNKSLLLLLHGNYEEGWRLYEWRWHLETYQPFSRRFSQPLWSGDADVAGKTILLYREQGYGDTIQMLRYLPLLVERGAKVIISVTAPLLPLVNIIPGVVCVVDKKEPLPEFDLHCPIMSLPLAFKTTLKTIPSAAPYLGVPENKQIFWQSRLGEKNTPRIGLVWSGVAAYKQDSERSVSLSTLLPLLEQKAEFHSLQIEYRAEDREILMKDHRLQDHSGEIIDFGDTAALINEMDLVISVDTSVAHLAGALGKPVWILLPYAPDFRWLLDREDSPWYPTARLFRQPAFNSWNKVVEGLMTQIIEIRRNC